MRSHRDPRTLLPALRGALQDLQVTVERMSVVNDHIVTWSRLRGVNRDGIPALGIPANGLRLDVPWVTVDRLSQNDEVAGWSVVDIAEVYRQLTPAEMAET